MQIIILNKHEQWPTQDTLNHYMILGVHSFTHFLIELQHKKKVQIFLKGDISLISDNIIWNQFFTASFLKDCYRFLTYEKGQENSFLKVNGRTFKLKDVMQWEMRYKMKEMLRRCGSFSIESFLNDGSIVMIDVDIGEKCMGTYDLLFNCDFETEQRNEENDLKVERCISGTKNKKKIMEQPVSAKKNLKSSKINHKYESQKKTLATTTHVKSTNKNHFISSTTQVRPQLNTHKKSINTLKKSQNQSVKTFSKPGKKQMQITSQQTQSNSDQFSSEDFDLLFNYKNDESKDEESRCMRKLRDSKSGMSNSKNKSIKNYYQSRTSFSKNSISTNKNNYRKQKIVEHLLLKKEDQVKKYKKQLENKESEFDEKVKKMQKEHETEILGLKEEVHVLLNKYKTKNKQLKKQNECLNEANGQLIFFNKKLEEKCSLLENEVKQNSHIIATIKREQQKTVLILDQIKQQKNQLRQALNDLKQRNSNEMGEKNQEIDHLKQKYEEMLGNIRKMAIGFSPKKQQRQKTRGEAFSDKQNILF